jgi:hypothetical protein
MGIVDSFTDWFGGTPSSHALLGQVNNVTATISTTLTRYAAIALVVSAGLTDVAHAQQKSHSEPATVPVIEAVEQAEVDSLYEQAKQINADESFDPEDLPEQAQHAKELVDEFEDVGQEIESLVDDGEIDQANKLLDVLETSLQNVHYNLSNLLASAQRSDGDKDLIRTLEDLTRDLKKVQDSIDAERNILASKTTNAVESLKQSVSEDPRASWEEKDGKLIIRITAESAKQSTARSKAVSNLHGHMQGTGLEGDTHFDVEIPDGNKKIKVSTITEIQLD